MTSVSAQVCIIRPLLPSCEKELASKASPAIEVTLVGIVTCVRFGQPVNALEPMVVMPLDRLTCLTLFPAHGASPLAAKSGNAPLPRMYSTPDALRLQARLLFVSSVPCVPRPTLSSETSRSSLPYRLTALSLKT